MSSTLAAAHPAAALRHRRNTTGRSTAGAGAASELTEVPSARPAVCGPSICSFLPSGAWRPLLAHRRTISTRHRPEWAAIGAMLEGGCELVHILRVRTLVCFLVAETTVPSLKGSDFQDVRTREIDSPRAAPIGIVVLLYSSMQVMNGFAMFMCNQSVAGSFSGRTPPKTG